jgi:hypothetical protein
VSGSGICLFPDAFVDERITQKPEKRLLGNGFFKRMVSNQAARHSGRAVLGNETRLNEFIYMTESLGQRRSSVAGPDAN